MNWRLENIVCMLVSSQLVLSGNVSGAPGQLVLPVHRSRCTLIFFEKIRKTFSALPQHQCMLSQKFKSKFKTMLKIRK